MFDLILKLFHKNSFDKENEEPKIYNSSECSIEFNLNFDDENQKQEVIFEILHLKHDRIIFLEIDSVENGILVKILSKESFLISDLYEKILKIFKESKNV
jgi:hypothetical protein